ncbi:hypothetical protein SCHPADRAFT_944668 [Schizopora paradoxa]|uniref:Xylosidase/arabinosidase n=1 Tax=Schizopora paradoxa TaxID=27342 RepID=A0A0H2RTL5_9AGAM|nr:hypothetical protein SCHPADRAFT_944668 [Schizopora paradoxa]
MDRFTCPGDGPPIAPGHHGWIHWFDKPIPDGGHPTIDAWPDVSDYSSDELYPAPGLSIDGKPALLFSSRNPKTVQRGQTQVIVPPANPTFAKRSVVDMARKLELLILYFSSVASKRFSQKMAARELDKVGFLSWATRESLRADPNSRFASQSFLRNGSLDRKLMSDLYLNLQLLNVPDRHFHLMAMHGVDGAFLQRFAGQCEVDGRTEGGNSDIMRWRDEVGDRVREAAEKEGRVFAIMYDVSGVPGDKIERVIKVDWKHLLCDKRILDSPAYLHEGGKPVVALWGLGFVNRGHDPESVRRIVQYIKSITPGGAYVMAGAPTHWQILRGDADPNPGFLDVWYNEFDAISPWSVGRYHNQEAADNFLVEKVKKDMKALRERHENGGRKVDYIPVIFPGASGNNLSGGKWRFNDDPRDGGKFFWRQLYNVRKEGVRTIYGAMWDEYDEATAILPIVQTKRQVPTPGKFLALDEDGYDLPSDWFMRISGFAVELLRGERMLHETFPVKELQDYWSSRPKYEVEASSQAEASGSSAGPSVHSEGVSESFDEWIEKEKEEKDEAPPPPYTLEASEMEAVPEESETRRASASSPAIRQEPAAPASVEAPQQVAQQVVQQSTQTSNVPRPLPAVQSPVDESRNSSGSRPTSGSSTLAVCAPPNRKSSLIVGYQGFTNNSAAAAQPSSPGNRTSTGSLNAGNSASSPLQSPSSNASSSYFPGGRTSPARNDTDVAALSGRFSQQSLQTPAPQDVRPASPYSHQHAPLSMLHSHHDESVPEQWPPPEWNVRPAHRPPSAAAAAATPSTAHHSRPPQAPFHVSAGHRPVTPGRLSHTPSPPASTTPGFRPVTPSAPFPGPSYPYPNPASNDLQYGYMPPAPDVPRPSGPGWAFENPSPFPQANYGASPSPPVPPSSTRPPPRVSSLSRPSPPSGPSLGPSYFPQAPADPMQRPGSAAYYPQDGPQSPYSSAPPQPAWPGYGYNNSPGGFAPPQPQYPSQYPMPSNSNYALSPPPVPPRPASAGAQNMPMPQYGNTGDRLVNAASGAYSLALGAVDKVAGSSTRRQVEHGVDTITGTGMKLFNKFTK